jgi:hypothetical protein
VRKFSRFLMSALSVIGLMGPASAWAQTKVLFEAMHAQTVGNADWVLDEDSCGTAQRYPTPAQSGITSSTPETYWGGAFSSFGVALVKKGFSVESLPTGGRITYGDTSNAQDLSNYKVLIIPEPNIRYTTAERTAIQSFVKNGGGLFLISDHWNSDRNNDGWDSPEIMNDLMVGVSWGIHFQVSPEADNWFDDNPDSKFTTDTSSPIIYTGPYGRPTAGKGLGLFGSTSMTLNPTANPNVKGHVWMTTGTVGATNRVTFATSTDGTGRIAAIGDSSPAEDATNNCGHTTHNGWNETLYDNALIHLNAVAWLAGAGGGGGGGGGTSIQNGGFESGATVWTASSGVITNDSTKAHAGSWLAWMDGYGSTHTDTLSQTLTIPSTATTLSFYLKITTAETGTTAYDKLTVQLKNTSGTVLTTLSTYSNVNASSSYALKSFNISAYAGQTVQLYFNGTEDSSLATDFMVDDVAVQ